MSMIGVTQIGVHVIIFRKNINKKYQKKIKIKIKKSTQITMA